MNLAIFSAQVTPTAPQIAQEFFDRANGEFDKTEYDAAIADLKRAIFADPHYIDAKSELEKLTKKPHN